MRQYVFKSLTWVQTEMLKEFRTVKRMIKFMREDF